MLVPTRLVSDPPEPGVAMPIMLGAGASAVAVSAWVAEVAPPWTTRGAGDELMVDALGAATLEPFRGLAVVSAESKAETLLFASVAEAGVAVVSTRCDGLFEVGTDVSGAAVVVPIVAFVVGGMDWLLGAGIVGFGLLTD